MELLMVVLLVVFFLMAFAHFIYEKIWWPTLMWKLKIDLFAIRDDLRNATIKYREVIDEKILEYPHEVVNASINALEKVTLSVFIKAIISLNENQEIKKEAAERIKLLEECGIEEVKDIYEKINQVVNYTLFYNTFMLLLYIFLIGLPILLLASLVSKLRKATTFVLCDATKNFIWMPPQRLCR